MSEPADSPEGSSSSFEDFAKALEQDLECTSSECTDHKEVVEEGGSHDSDSDSDLEQKRVKKPRLELPKSMDNPECSLPCGEPSQNLVSSCVDNISPHPGNYAGMCIKCGKNIDDESGVAFGYIDEKLRLTNDEISRLKDIDMKNLLRHRKLCLVLDLDHTLLNSANFAEITEEEGYLMDEHTLPDAFKGSVFSLGLMEMLTKLRPYVDTFLEEANKLFDMYIYTMGMRLYSIEMSELLDPDKIYFTSKVIAKEDCTKKNEKSLDVVLAKESTVLILDDSEWVWPKDNENLILMERYHFFSSSCMKFGCDFDPPSELRSDESETDGALSTVLKIIQRIHTMFFDPDGTDNLENRDVRQVLNTVRKEVLNGCKIVFSSVLPSSSNLLDKHLKLLKMAEQLGATCSTEVDPSVTHVVSADSETDKARWALQENKFLVNPKWIEASNYSWKKAPEENFPVTEVKSILDIDLNS